MVGLARSSPHRRLQLGPLAAISLAALIVVQLILAVLYVRSPVVGVIENPAAFGFTLLQPFIWIDVGLIAVLTTDPPPASGRRWRLGTGLAVTYFIALAYFGGLFAGGAGTGVAGVNWTLPPGYSPRVYYDGAMLALALEPYKVVGYASLAYLVYVTILDALGTVLSGVIGLFSCISCSWPILGTVLAGVFGGSSAVTAAALNQAYPLSTLVFLSAVLLLWWRPGVADGSGASRG